MTVQELINRLEQFDPETPVHFAYPAGDYWRTTLARTPTYVGLAQVAHSSYHEEFKLLEEAEEEEGNQVVILS